ncbi:alpha/beta fold hydrolase [Nocardia callitridis]|uniref:Alpha/beta hydrolase n=1 Tax=Nocardia callitridis TaxID=648753 RepID=A0ABP9KU56_9NOCA
MHRSDRLASATLLEPGGATFGKPDWRVLLEFLAAGIRPTPERMRKLNRWLMPRYDMDDESFAMAQAAAKFKPGMPWERTLTDDELAEISAPMFVLFGAETVANDPEIGAARARRHIPSAQVEIMPDIGHDLLWANADDVIPRFLAFVASHDQVEA